MKLELLKNWHDPSKTCWISLKRFLSCGKSIVLYLTSSTRPGEGKIGNWDNSGMYFSLNWKPTISKLLSGPSQHLLITLRPGSLSICYAHMQNYPLRTGHFKSEIPEWKSPSMSVKWKSTQSCAHLLAKIRDTRNTQHHPKSCLWFLLSHCAS